SWHAARPGEVLLTVILPFVLLGVVGTGLICGVMLRRIRQTSVELAARESAAQFEARHDALSGLPNRQLFTEEISARVTWPADGPANHSLVCYLDIDRFKDVNDTLGHPAGDALIKAVAARLRERLPEGELLARFGGDEFAILRLDAREQDAEQLTRVIAASFE